VDEALFWRGRQFIGWLLGFLGIVLALFSGFDLFERLGMGQEPRSWIPTVYVLLITLVMTVAASYYVFSAIRKERYANIMRPLHAITHQARDIYTYIINKEPRGSGQEAYELYATTAKSMFGDLLDQVSVIFTTLTSTRCRAAIKLVYKVNNDFYVCTLTRDRNSRQDCAGIDDNRLEHNRDPLYGNTHLTLLSDSDNNSWHYISNDLVRAVKNKEYLTTSELAYSSGRPPGNKKWVLPYRSCLTCVIGQAKFEECPSLRTEIPGFLTVDSESRGVFEERWDKELIFLIADALFAPLTAYLQAVQRGKDAPPPPEARNAGQSRLGAETS
jgi:hypothetical protein